MCTRSARPARASCGSAARTPCQVRPPVTTFRGGWAGGGVGGSGLLTGLRGAADGPADGRLRPGGVGWPGAGADGGVSGRRDHQGGVRRPAQARRPPALCRLHQRLLRHRRRRQRVRRLRQSPHHHDPRPHAAHGDGSRAREPRGRAGLRPRQLAGGGDHRRARLARALRREGPLHQQRHGVLAPRVPHGPRDHGQAEDRQVRRPV